MHRISSSSKGDQQRLPLRKKNRRKCKQFQLQRHKFRHNKWMFKVLLMSKVMIRSLNSVEVRKLLWKVVRRRILLYKFRWLRRSWKDKPLSLKSKKDCKSREKKNKKQKKCILLRKLRDKTEKRIKKTQNQLKMQYQSKQNQWKHNRKLLLKEKPLLTQTRRRTKKTKLRYNNLKKK